MAKKDKYHGLTAVDWARSDGCSEEEIEAMLQKPSLEDMEFPDPKQVLENLTRKVISWIHLFDPSAKFALSGLKWMRDTKIWINFEGCYYD